MESIPFTDFPDLTRNTLVEMGGSIALREARALMKAGSVDDISWEKPVLTGSVRQGGDVFKPRLNLRSMVFTDNRCSCDTGRRGLVCVHSLALCLAVERDREQALDDGAETEDEPAPSPPRAPESPSGELQSIRTTEDGISLVPWILLPPNFSKLAQKSMIPLKMELEIEGRRFPPEKLPADQAYRLSPALHPVLQELENRGGGKLHSLVQLQPQVLAALLEALAGEGRVAWVNHPQDPIPWNGRELPGVTPYLQPATTPPVERKPPETKKITPPARRVRTRKSATSDSSPGLKIEVDGSEHFLAFRFSSTSDPRARDWIDTLKDAGFLCEPSNGRYWLRDRHHALNFLARHGEVLEGDPTVRWSSNFKQRTTHLHRARFQIDTHASGGDFEVAMSLDVGDLAPGEIQRALLSNQFYLQSGKSITLFSPELLERATDLQQNLTGQKDRVLTTRFKTRLKSPHLPVAAEFLESFDPEYQLPETWTARSGALRSIHNLQPAPLSDSLENLLRGYQRIGTAWLWHLYRHDLGGILADEMGLGKTLQALGLIQAAVNHSAGRTPPRHGDSQSVSALVVCPAGLIENWRREALRFTPELRVFRHHGNDRLQKASDLASYDVIITSYGTLVRDQELFQSTPFLLALADEAQHVKNRRTQASRALRSLQARGRFILTGTPIENAVDDLRGLFAFLMPGYLNAIPRNLNREEREWYDRRHLDQVAPYILRRTKSAVAPELPEKIEQTVYCEMSPVQQRFYDAVRLKTEKQIFEMEMAGANENKIKFAALTQLLRLRQVCADPRVLDPDFKARDSAKIAALQEILEEATDDHHRILLFSQFTSVLKLLAQYLESRSVAYCYLDGSTPRRQDVCDRFNRDPDIPVFLMSLKAGGVGLNLTGADTVIHFDPWWNPAVEAQATDRAHRIGQTRVVTSLRFITVNTVEEKVMDIQKSKAALLEDLFEASDSATSKVSLADIKALLSS